MFESLVKKENSNKKFIIMHERKNLTYILAWISFFLCSDLPLFENLFFKGTKYVSWKPPKVNFSIAHSIIIDHMMFNLYVI